MPPKKEEPVKKVKLGRPGNTLKMGIVGLPNVGKSTTFNLLSNLNIPAENYPFCTIDPNLAKVFVDDERFDKLCEIHKPKSKVPATLSIMDIAGLVPGASKGEGLGNAFLSHIRETDAIYHVVRAFDDPEITHTENEVNPVRDMQIISDELVYKDQEILGKRLEEVNHKINRFNDKDAKEEKEILDKVDALLKAKKWVRTADWNATEVDILNKYMFLTSKPVVYLVNLSSEDYMRKKNKWLVKIKEWITTNCPGEIIPYSADHEKQILEGKQDSKTSMMSRIIKTGYKVLDLIYFFTAGPDEVRAWTVRAESRAPQAAGVIHTDFEKGFICAEIMKYDDFIAAGSENAVKAEGKYYQKGKEYVVQDGDIIFFKFNVSKDGKKK
ncbi:GTP-binding protein YchF (macronuclear) [Tetrahymena thermophila SB210]|uniref:Obg-like ATPase 1 n=1 Tax=Tetrahymena thermophila (strain SB210) TaxID=312017 RepID=I7MIE8_TETTS|nr:GTP-binding protein YchF [Tetrahymena thermophila SB210]EAS04323.1 GTP-binding protein YchF [Tetrahymena thermophila SB210]|eukprot:XP_001024568.1 GTP-binding protein YchF [Tetrahymena thermophila SB210]